MRKLTTQLMAALCLTIVLAQPAFATLINEWSYSLTYNFADYWNQNGDDDGLTLDETGTKLSWGSGGTSSIGYIDKTGSIFTGSTVNILDHLYHNNQPIDGDSLFLQGGVLSATLTLQGIDPATASDISFDTVLTFLFFETTNVNGNNYDNDIFILTNPSAGSGTFAYDGYYYDFSFLSGFGTLDTADLLNYSYLGTNVLDYLATMAGSEVTYAGHWENGVYVLDEVTPESLYGWTTPEEQATYISSQLTINATPVPEPSTFAFLGLGLTALAFVGRKMRRQ